MGPEMGAKGGQQPHEPCQEGALDPVARKSETTGDLCPAAALICLRSCRELTVLEYACSAAGVLRSLHCALSGTSTHSCSPKVTLPGVQDSGRHSSEDHWGTQVSPQGSGPSRGKDLEVVTSE